MDGLGMVRERRAAARRGGERLQAADASVQGIVVHVAIVVGLMLAGCTGPAPAAPPQESVAPPPAPLSPPEPENAPPESLEPTSADTSRTSGTVRVHYVNVGQGDGTIWELPGGSVVVYDCGPPANATSPNRMVAALRALGLEPGATIQALVASHGHLDHVGGCGEILEQYRILHLYDTWYEGSDAPQSYRRFREELKAEGGTIHTLAATASLEGEQPFQRGDRLALTPGGEAAGVVARILWPPTPEDDWDRIANGGIVVRLSFGSVDFCFQGDIEAAQEATLADALAGQDCEVYLVGHHGSKAASSAGWLAALDPEVAVVSFGKNSYGHPTSEALCRVQQAGAKVYATHRVGDVTVATDGAGLTVHPDHPESNDYCAAGASYWT